MSGMSKGITTRQRIVERAFSIATVDGLEGLTLGRLADDVGMSKSGLFAHFTSKEELDLAILEIAVEKFTEIVVRPALTVKRGEPRVRALFERWLVWERDKALPGGCIFVQLGAELDARPGAARDAYVDTQRRWIDLLAAAARIAVDEEHFRPNLDVRRFALQVHAVFLGYAHAKRVLREKRAEAFARQSFDELIASARCPGPRARRTQAEGRGQSSGLT
jgi:AcrR family transcriptional regulator